MKKILAVSSSGGHWIQLLQLKKEIFDNHDTVYIGTNIGMCTSLDGRNFNVVTDCNLGNKWKTIKCFFQVLRLVIKIKPDLIITTGAAPGFLALVCGKIIKTNTIWIDSLANTKKLSVSGKYAKYFADVWLTQWELVQEISQEPKLLYRGKLI